MSEATVNLRISRSGLAIPVHNMGKEKANTSPKPGASANTGVGTKTNKEVSLPTGDKEDTLSGNMILGSVQDIWGLLISMQTSMLKQSEEIKHLALKNQELEYKLQTQEVKFQELQETINKQANTIHDTLATHDAKITQVSERPLTHISGSGGSWASIVKNEQANMSTSTPYEEMYTHEDNKEFKEQEKRKMNIVIRGIPEADKEQALILNTDITDLISTKFGMHDIVVYGAHRVGKNKPNTNRAVVCTLLDARKRAIILENARIYLQDSPYYISEDRTPNQQKARREAYEARTNKKTSAPKGSKAKEPGEQEK